MGQRSVYGLQRFGEFATFIVRYAPRVAKCLKVVVNVSYFCKPPLRTALRSAFLLNMPQIKMVSTRILSIFHRPRHTELQR